jgi:hypothetical protein
MMASAFRSFFSWALPGMGVNARFFMDTKVWAVAATEDLPVRKSKTPRDVFLKPRETLGTQSRIGQSTLGEAEIEAHFNLNPPTHIQCHRAQ